MQVIISNHDVSKHRMAIYGSAKHRTEAPSGFFEDIGVGDSESVRHQYWPLLETHIDRDPKNNLFREKPNENASPLLLEDIAPKFSSFVTESCRRAWKDAEQNIVLPSRDISHVGY